MITIFTRRVCGREVHFTKHAVQRHRERLLPDASRADARLALKTGLDGARVVRELRPSARLSRWARALAREYLVYDAEDGRVVAFPLNKDVDGTWVAPTCMILDRNDLM